ncbi:MAG: quinol oxidase [Deltaproteobacteria bacterium]|nr:quinol oxidase [Deltaproteobacteria bacterium]
MKALIMSLMLLAATTVVSLADEPPFVVPIAHDGVQRVEILGGDYFFRPRHIVVKVNLPVELVARKETFLTPHNLVIAAPEAGISVHESLSRDPQGIAFTPTKTGKYAIYCDKKLLFMDSHREKGMEAVLEVVE